MGEEFKAALAKSNTERDASISRGENAVDRLMKRPDGRDWRDLWAERDAAKEASSSSAPGTLYERYAARWDQAVKDVKGFDDAIVNRVFVQVMWEYYCLEMGNNPAIAMSEDQREAGLTKYMEEMRAVTGGKNERARIALTAITAAIDAAVRVAKESPEKNAGFCRWGLLMGKFFDRFVEQPNIGANETYGLPAAPLLSMASPSSKGTPGAGASAADEL
jgi:hypothetical protein